MAKMIGSGILHLSLLTVTGWQWHASKIVYFSLPTTFNAYAWGRLFIILRSWNPLPEWELLGFLGDRYSYDEESKRKEERQETRVVWFSSYKDGHIIPGFVQSNRCLVCHHGGEAYKPMSHLKGKLQKEVPAKVLLFHSNQQQCCTTMFPSNATLHHQPHIPISLKLPISNIPHAWPVLDLDCLFIAMLCFLVCSPKGRRPCLQKAKETPVHPDHQENYVFGKDKNEEMDFVSNKITETQLMMWILLGIISCHFVTIEQWVSMLSERLYM